MARKTASRLELRRQAEIADAQGPEDDESKVRRKRKVARRKKTTRAKRAKEAPQRKRLLWGIFNGSMKEEARFPYDQREAAEEKLEQLRAKSKKMYFIQPIKEPITEAPPATDSGEGKAAKKAKK